MQQSIIVRDLERDDLARVRTILEATALFPLDMLDEMVAPYLSKHASHQWFVACDGEQVVGFAYVEPERMTDGTYNLLAIAVDPAVQGSGVGRSLVAGLITRLRDQGGRVLLVETSSLDDFAATRKFYIGQCFTEEARIRDFYADKEDKLVFWKRL